MKEIIKEIVNNLINKNYDYIIERSIEKRCNADDLKTEIDDYPGNLTLPPNEAFDNFEFYEIEDKDELIADFFLWFDNEPSDLMIQVLIYTDKINKYSFWDILVP
jgi:hypothetical protein